MKQQQGEQNQKDDPREGAPNGPLLQQQSAYENAKRHESKRAEQRIARCCLNESDKFSHVCRSCRTLSMPLPRAAAYTFAIPRETTARGQSPARVQACR